MTEVEAYSQAGVTTPYASFCWNGLLKENSVLMTNPSSSFVWGVENSDELAAIKCREILGVITDFPEEVS
jgi:hypothetical protein